MRFFLDLDDSETQQWRDACNWYKENPNERPREFRIQQKSRERIIQIGNQLGIDVYPGTPPPTPPPDPAPTDALARFDARAKVGQNCAWRQGLWEDAAFKPLQARLENAGVQNAHVRISQQLQFYNAISNVHEKWDAALGLYVFVKDEKFEPDVDGAADAYIAQTAAGGPWPVPPPLA